MSRELRAVFLLAALLGLSELSAAETMPSRPNSCGNGLLHICPSELRPNAQAILTMPVKHPPGLAVLGPSGTWSFVFDPHSDSPSAMDFRTSTRFQFNVSELKGTQWKADGSSSEERVFCESGTYVIYLADNLETEPDNTRFHAISISYVGDANSTCKCRQQ